MRKLILLVAVVTPFVLAACVHRPYYRELVADADGQSELTFRLLNAADGQPLPGVRVRVTAGLEKVSVVTDEKGVFTLPVKKSMMDPYTVVDVSRPNGVERYTIERVAAAETPAQPTHTTAPAPDDGASKKHIDTTTEVGQHSSTSNTTSDVGQGPSTSDTTTEVNQGTSTSDTTTEVNQGASTSDTTTHSADALPQNMIADAGI